jgi:hypothetical protein
MRTPKVSKEEFLAAIREGVRDAMWDMMTNATIAPCHDFYDSIREGVREAIESREDQTGKAR